MRLALREKKKRTDIDEYSPGQSTRGFGGVAGMEEICNCGCNSCGDKHLKESTGNKILYVLIGPPASGKSTWIKQNITSKNLDYAIVSRDDIILQKIHPKYGIGGKELYGTKPPETAKVGDVDPQHGEVFLSPYSGKPRYKKYHDINSELDTYEQEARKEALSHDVIVVDKLNLSTEQRKDALAIVAKNPEYKKVAVVLYPDLEKLKAGEEKRAAAIAAQGGQPPKKMDPEYLKKKFEEVSAITDELLRSEGFDQIIKPTPAANLSERKKIQENKMKLTLKERQVEEVSAPQEGTLEEMPNMQIRDQATQEDFRPIVQMITELRKMLDAYVKANPQHAESARARVKRGLGLV
jgi:hypothetical protein